MQLAPYLVTFFAMAGYALMGPIAKKVGGDLQPFTFIALVSALLLTTSSIVALFLERQGFIEALSRLNWSWLVLYSACNFVSYIGYLWAIGRIPVAQYEMFGIFVPIIGGIAATLILKEPFHARYIAGIAVMAIGLYIAIKPDLQVK